MYLFSTCYMYIPHVVIGVLTFDPHFQREVDESIDLLRNKKAELMSLLDYLRAQPETVDVDDAVMATNPLYNQ